MKETGIIRRIDDLGRIAIPKEIRRTLAVKEGDPLEIFIDSGAICLKKYNALAPFENTLESVIDMLNDEDVSCKISVDERAVVCSVINMLLAKWKESEDTQ